MAAEAPLVSVVLPAHNPEIGRLGRTLRGLAAQTLPASAWELLVVDNASARFPDADWLRDTAGRDVRLVREARLGLTSARLRAIREAAGGLLVFVDDDNVLEPAYLERAQGLFLSDGALGAAGGWSRPEYAARPPEWIREFHGLLALRDLGTTERRAAWDGRAERSYPPWAPIGAGLVVRRAAAEAYADQVAADPRRQGFDRRGARLTSGGDNDLVLTVLEAGFAVAYRPELGLTHLIPAARCDPVYLGALNRAMSRSWVSVLALHGLQPWPPLRHGRRLRQARAWLRSAAWRGPAEWIRWQGLCGLFEGRADLAHLRLAAGPSDDSLTPDPQHLP